MNSAKKTADALESNFKKLVARKDFAEAHDTELFIQQWVDREEECDSEYKKDDEALRVIQFNVLSHGQTNVGCGFTPLFKETDKQGLPSYCAAIKDAIKKGDFGVDNHKEVQKYAKKLAKKSPTLTLEDAENRLENDWEDAKRRHAAGKFTTGTHPEIMTTDEENWIHSQDYRELLFSRTWGPKEKNSEGKMGFPFPERLKRVVGMVLKQNPDIITMQEVDRFADMLQILSSVGYDGRIQKKDRTQNNPSYNGNGGVSEDGVAIFWNTSRLKFIEQTEEAYNILHKDFPTKKNNAKQRVLFVTLYDTVKKQNVLVVSGHFKSGNTEGDKKDKRVMVQEFAKKLKEKGSSVDGVIFACDFNASRESGAFKLFHDGKCDQ